MLVQCGYGKGKEINFQNTNLWKCYFCSVLVFLILYSSKPVCSKYGLAFMDFYPLSRVFWHLIITFKHKGYPLPIQKWIKEIMYIGKRKMFRDTTYDIIHYKEGNKKMETDCTYSVHKRFVLHQRKSHLQIITTITAIIK